MIDSLGRSARRAKPFTAARLVAASAELAERFPRAGTAGGAELRDDALALVGDAVASQVEAAPPARAAVQRDQAVWVSSPVRLDLAGGWSDTPPICNEHGGTVLNAAVALHGADPVQVVVKVTDEPAIALHSVDLGLAETITTSAALHEHRDPRQWTSLLKAALVLSGFAPRTPRASLRRFLERFGGGLTLSAFSAVPKGSGLGTSSILGAAVLACLDRVAGRPMDRRSLIDRTSVLEQMIATRGGWQDQVGGIVGGIKISRTTPGAAQHPVTETIDVDEATMTRLARRTVLFYTGQRRMARDILQTVVGRYLVRDRAVADAIPRLKAGAESMRDALVSGDVDAFGVELLRYWRLKCTVDPNATNPAIEAMIGRLRADLAAWELPGAGGGGFLFMLANDDDAAARIRRRLERSPPNASARVFDFEVEPAGMKVTVL